MTARQLLLPFPGPGALATPLVPKVEFDEHDEPVWPRVDTTADLSVLLDRLGITTAGDGAS